MPVDAAATRGTDDDDDSSFRTCELLEHALSEWYVAQGVGNLGEVRGRDHPHRGFGLAIELGGRDELGLLAGFVEPAELDIDRAEARLPGGGRGRLGQVAHHWKDFVEPPLLAPHPRHDDG